MDFRDILITMFLDYTFNTAIGPLHKWRNPQPRTHVFRRRIFHMNVKLRMYKVLLLNFRRHLYVI